MTSNFLAEANKLKNIQSTLEKNEHILLEHLRKHGDVHIIEFYDELEASRKKETEAISSDYNSITSTLNKFKSLINMDPVDIVSDLNQIKREMFTFENNIKTTKIKQKQSLEKLKEQEKKLEEEIKLYEQKIVYWSKHINISEAVYHKTTQNQQTTNQDVTDFLTYLGKNGGHTNSWSPEDHSLFLKARGKCKDVRELCEHIHAMLPDITVEEVEMHEKWYVKYIELKRKHKDAIKNWRQTKSAAVINNNKNSKAEDEEMRIKSAYSREKPLDKEDIRYKLQQWKQEKQERMETDKLIKMEMRKRRQEIDDRRRQRQEEMKRAVENWKLERIEKEQMEKLEKYEAEKQQREFKAAMANRLIKEFQSQDDMFIRRRRESRKPKAKSFDRLPVCNISAPRDPTRLLKPTKQWINRLQSNENQKRNDKPNIKTVPKLGIPEWRKNLII